MTRPSNRRTSRRARPMVPEYDRLAGPTRAMDSEATAKLEGVMPGQIMRVERVMGTDHYNIVWRNMPSPEEARQAEALLCGRVQHGC